MSVRKPDAHERRRWLVALVAVTLALSASGVAIWRSASPVSCIGPTEYRGFALPDDRVDSAFAAAMIAHHQQAIEMARAELRDGRNEQLLRLSQEIIITQQQEIAAMRLAIGQATDPAERLRGKR